MTLGEELECVSVVDGDIRRPWQRSGQIGERPVCLDGLEVDIHAVAQAV